MNDVDEQRQTKKKGECLKPNERSARIIGSGFRFFGEFFCVTGGPVVCEVFSRFNQGDELTPLVVAFGFSGQPGNNSLTTCPGNGLNPLSQSSGKGLLSSRKFPVNANSVGTKLRLS